MIGFVKVLKEGFGFISSIQRDGDTFFHASQMFDSEAFDSLNEGTLVDFDIGEVNNGKLQGINVYPFQLDNAGFKLVKETTSL